MRSKFIKYALKVIVTVYLITFIFLVFQLFTTFNLIPKNLLNQDNICDYKKVSLVEVNLSDTFTSKELSMYPEVENLLCIGRPETSQSDNIISIDEFGIENQSLTRNVRIYSSNNFISIYKLSFIIVLTSYIILFIDFKKNFFRVTSAYFLFELFFKTLNHFGINSISTSILTFNILLISYLFKENLLDLNSEKFKSIEQIKFRNDINLLRGLSVVMVIFYHLEIKSFINGYLGVDIFFVISGFLISSQIISKLYSDKFNLLEFYSKRVKRLLPSIISLSIFVIIIFWNTVYPFIYSNYLRILFYNSIYVVNFYFHNFINYFTADAFFNPLLHLWSISVEEQYYIFLPLVFIFLFKNKKSFNLNLLVIYIFSISYFYFTQHYYLIFGRLWQFLLGYFAFLIFLNLREDQKLQRTKFYTVIFLILFIVLFNQNFLNFIELTLFISFLTLFYLINHYFFIDISKNKLIIFTCFVGSISYSAYLFHQPIIVWFKLRNYFNNDILFVVLIIFLVSFMNFFFIENKFRYFSTSNIKTLRIGFLSILFISMFTLTFPKLDLYDFLQESKKNYSEIHIENLNKIFLNIDNKKNNECFINNNKFDDEFYLNFEECSSKGEKAVLVIGDSIAGNVSELLYKENKFIINLSDPGCNISFEKVSRCNHDKIVDFYKKEKNYIEYVFYAQGTSHFFIGNIEEVRLRKFANKNTFSLNELNYVFDYLDNFDKNNIFVIGPWVIVNSNPLNTSQNLLNSSTVFVDNKDILVFESIDKNYKNLTEFRNFKYISTLDFYKSDPQNYFYNFKTKSFNFEDTSHLSQFGIEKFSPILLEKVKN